MELKTGSSTHDHLIESYRDNDIPNASAPETKVPNATRHQSLEYVASVPKHGTFLTPVAETADLAKLPNPRPEVFTLGHFFQDALPASIAAHLRNTIAHPIQLDIPKLQCEEDHKAGDSDGAGEGCRSHKIIL